MASLLDDLKEIAKDIQWVVVTPRNPEEAKVAKTYEMILNRLFTKFMFEDI